MKIHKDYLDKKIDLDGSYPLDIHLSTVDGCPYNCVMCEFGNSKVENVSFDVLEKIKPAFNTLEVLSIHGSGESLLSDKLDYIIDNSKKYKFVIHTNTTGAMLTKAKSDALSKAYGLSIRFSIHAGKAETYYKIMGEDFDTVIEKIKYLIKITENSNTDYWFSYIVMKENIDEIEEFLTISADCGIKSVRFMRLTPNFSNVKGISLRELDFKFFEQYNNKIIDKFHKNLPKYKDLTDKLGIHIEFGTINQYNDTNHIGDLINKVTGKSINKRFLPIIPPKGTCVVPWYGEAIITLNGDVKLCVQSNYIIGNIHKNNLQEIWNSKKMQDIRKAFSNGYKHKVCGYCDGLDIDNYPNNTFLDISRKPK